MLNFKEICQFYKGMIAERDLLESKLDGVSKDDCGNYANIFILKHLNACIALADKTYECLEKKYGKEITDILRASYIDGTADKDLAEQLDMPLRTFARRKTAWIGSVEQDVVEELSLRKGIDYGEPYDVLKPSYKYPKAENEEDPKEWLNTVKTTCKSVNMHLKNIQSCNASIALARHSMMNVRSISGERSRGSSSVSKDEMYARMIDRIDRYTEKKKEYVSKIQWLFKYFESEPNPIVRTLVPLIYINKRKFGTIAEESDSTVRALRLSLEKSMRYPGKKEI